MIAITTKVIEKNTLSDPSIQIQLDRPSTHPQARCTEVRCFHFDNIIITLNISIGRTVRCAAKVLQRWCSSPSRVVI